MQTPAILLVLLLCALLALYWSRRRNAWSRSDTPWPFHAKRPKPHPEQALYQRLVSGLPAHIVLAHVALVDVLGVKRGFDRRLWSRRIRNLHYDFVVCTKDGTVLAAITLGETVREHNRRSQSEAFTERASAAAGVRLLRWHTRALPDLAEIRAAFSNTETPFFEDAASNGNASWWPPVATDKRSPPTN